MNDIKNIELIEIYNVLGVKVESYKVENCYKENIKIDVATLTKGIYFVRIKTKDNLYNSKFIKE